MNISSAPQACPELPALPPERRMDLVSPVQGRIGNANVQKLSFTGDGKEYFRIWIVNLCLTIATLGVYSAWAKVRRLQYFDRNTQLAGAVFNFHGEPLAILRGRLIAVILLFFYHYVFVISKTFAVLIVALLLLGMPMMLRSAQRFRLRNTSYRGLRFNFHGAPWAAYLTYLPVVALFVVPGLLAVLYPGQLSWVMWSFLLYLSWPWLYARMKRYSLGQFSYGSLHSSCSLSASAFLWPYFWAAFFLLIVGVVAGIATGVVIAVTKSFNPGAQFQFNQIWISATVILLAAIFSYLAYVICGPMLQASIWNRSWSATQLSGVRIYSRLPLWAYLRLQSVNLVLTLLSLGLYRPFAVVRAYRFRLAHIELLSFDLDGIAASSAQTEHAAGESSADFFGFDVSW